MITVRQPELIRSDTKRLQLLSVGGTSQSRLKMIRFIKLVVIRVSGFLTAPFQYFLLKKKHFKFTFCNLHFVTYILLFIFVENLLV